MKLANGVEQEPMKPAGGRCWIEMEPHKSFTRPFRCDCWGFQEALNMVRARLGLFRKATYKAFLKLVNHLLCFCRIAASPNKDRAKTIVYPIQHLRWRYFHLLLLSVDLSGFRVSCQTNITIEELMSQVAILLILHESV